MIVYQTNADGTLAGAVELNDTDKCPITGNWLIPGGCVETTPPEGKEGFERVWKNGAWQYVEIPKEPEPTMDELKVAKWVEIKSKRDALEQSGVAYLGKVIDSDTVSVQRIAVAVQAAQAAISASTDFTLDWTCQDNTVLTMTAAQVVGMSVALATYSNQLHQTARELRDQIEAATTVDELDSIDVEVAK